MAGLILEIQWRMKTDMKAIFHALFIKNAFSSLPLSLSIFLLAVFL